MFIYSLYSSIIGNRIPMMSGAPLITMRETKFNSSSHFKTLSDEDLFTDEVEPLNSILSKFKYWFVFFFTLKKATTLFYRYLTFLKNENFKIFIGYVNRPRNGNKIYTKRSMLSCGLFLFTVGFLIGFLIFGEMNLSRNILPAEQPITTEEILQRYESFREKFVFFCFFE